MQSIGILSTVKKKRPPLRYEVEGGVQTRAGHHQIDIGAFEKLGQAIGFTPSRAAEMYEGATAVKNAEKRITERRNYLLDRYAAGVKEKGSAGAREVMPDIGEFNQRNPTMAITGATLLRSLRGRARQEAGMREGLYLPPKRESLRDTGVFANVQ